MIFETSSKVPGRGTATRTSPLGRAGVLYRRDMSTTRVQIAEAAREWHPTGVWLNTASYGLPPDCAWEALQGALEDWRGGRTSWEHWGDSTEGARAAFAALVGVAPEAVATGATVSELIGLVAASIPDGARVLAPDIDFASVLFPFMVQERRGVDVRLVPPSRLPDEIDDTTDVVAFSAVQMASGEVADLDAVANAAAAHGALTLVDGTQGCGWLHLDASRFDVVVCHAYKWLMAPRGTAFMAVRPDLLDRIVPAAAGWWAGDDPHTSYFGPPLRLTSDARRLDASPAWFPWVGTQPALELVVAIGVEAIHDHDVGLANRFRAGLGLEPSNSAIVVADVPGARERLERAGITAAERGGRLRTAWHVYNTEADVDAALDALQGS
jgi:selenocysteine lyase/cysteine desulfurase